MQHYDDGTPVPEDTAERVAMAEVREWFRLWHHCWEAAVEVGATDAIGSREYSRLTAEARFHRVTANAVDMRHFIRDNLVISNTPSITQESLAKRQARQRKEAEHGED
jgi:hypothetical protein